MTPEMAETLAERIDEVFLFFAIAILVIELAEAAFKRTLFRRTLPEMLVSASTQIPFLLVEIFMLTAAYGVYYLLAETVVPWQIPITAWTLVIVLVLADLTYYWEHRIAHEVRILWTQHAVHHSSRDYNIVTGIRFGPLEGLWSLIAHLPLVCLGFSPEAVFFGVIVVQAYQAWIHTELVGRLGWIDRVLNTPSNHRVHHGSDDKYLDRNYGGILIIWDRIFGTYQPEEETPRYGLKGDFDSRNPLRVWFSELPALWRDLKAARGWRRAWKVLVSRPGAAID